MSHTDTTPSVSPLSRYLPDLKQSKKINIHNQSFVIREVTVLFKVFSLKIKVVNKADLRVQVKVDSLVSGNVPLQ